MTCNAANGATTKTGTPRKVQAATQKCDSAAQQVFNAFPKMLESTAHYHSYKQGLCATKCLQEQWIAIAAPAACRGNVTTKGTHGIPSTRPSCIHQHITVTGHLPDPLAIAQRTALQCCQRSALNNRDTARPTQMSTHAW